MTTKTRVEAKTTVKVNAHTLSLLKRYHFEIFLNRNANSSRENITPQLAERYSVLDNNFYPGIFLLRTIKTAHYLMNSIDRMPTIENSEKDNIKQEIIRQITLHAAIVLNIFYKKLTIFPQDKERLKLALNNNQMVKYSADSLRYYILKSFRQLPASQRSHIIESDLAYFYLSYFLLQPQTLLQFARSISEFGAFSVNCIKKVDSSAPHIDFIAQKIAADLSQIIKLFLKNTAPVNTAAHPEITTAVSLNEQTTQALYNFLGQQAIIAIAGMLAVYFVLNAFIQANTPLLILASIGTIAATTFLMRVLNKVDVLYWSPADKGFGIAVNNPSELEQIRLPNLNLRRRQDYTDSSQNESAVFLQNMILQQQKDLDFRIYVYIGQEPPKNQEPTETDETETLATILYPALNTDPVQRLLAEVPAQPEEESKAAANDVAASVQNEKVIALDDEPLHQQRIQAVEEKREIQSSRYPARLNGLPEPEELIQCGYVLGSDPNGTSIALFRLPISNKENEAMCEEMTQTFAMDGKIPFGRRTGDFGVFKSINNGKYEYKPKLSNDRAGDRQIYKKGNESFPFFNSQGQKKTLPIYEFEQTNSNHRQIR